MSFTIPLGTTTAYLESEESGSLFRDISVATKDITMLFGVRQSTIAPQFIVNQADAETCSLQVSNPRGDFAVVTQYLDTPLRELQSFPNATHLTGNVFFSCWIISGTDSSASVSNLIVASVVVKPLSLGLLYFSIFFTVLVLIILVFKTVKNSLVKEYGGSK
jgi:hypothetical protein